MAGIRSYKDLLVWQKGITIVKEIYLICKNELPQDELYGLQSQIKRSSISIPSNIAEGWGRKSNKSNLQFLRYATGSLYEVETQLFLAKELDFISTESFDKIQNLITEESKMLFSFMRSVENKIN